MSAALWLFEAAVAAAGGKPEGVWPKQITGISIDTRSIANGDLFVALKDQRDGHEFVTTAFANGAAAALVSNTYERKPGDGALIRVDDPLAALENLGRAARARLLSEARVFAVTGSVGKTTAKDMLRACCARLGPTHASDKSFNNHWGVPLTLARMPAETHFAVFEIGMNHAGEIMPLVAMVRPHVAIVTTVEAAHIEHFGSEEAIADAKAEIFSGLLPGGTAVINAANRHFERLVDHAVKAGACIFAFGNACKSTDLHDERIARWFEIDRLDGSEDGSRIVAHSRPGGQRWEFLLGSPGSHMALNALAVLAAIASAGLDSAAAVAALAGHGPPPGRGSRITLAAPGGPLLVIDESYNANPASMRAALSVLGDVPRDRFPRRIAVLGDMLELGADAAALHTGLWPAVEAADVQLVFAAGPNMEQLYEKVQPGCRGAWALHSKGIEERLLTEARAGDVIMIKGSNGSRMATLVAALKAKFSAAS